MIESRMPLVRAHQENFLTWSLIFQIQVRSANTRVFGTQREYVAATKSNGRYRQRGSLARTNSRPLYVRVTPWDMLRRRRATGTLYCVDYTLRTQTILFMNFIQLFLLSKTLQFTNIYTLDMCFSQSFSCVQKEVRRSGVTKTSELSNIRHTTTVAGVSVIPASAFAYVMVAQPFTPVKLFAYSSIFTGCNS